MSIVGSRIQYEVRRPASFVTLLFGAAAAPLLWTGQLLLNYTVMAHWCYSGDHSEAMVSIANLRAAMLAFDVVAILGALAGGISAWLCYLKVCLPDAARDPRFAAAEGRARFLSILGIFSSLWFLSAIVFNSIASLTMPPCLI